MTRTEAIDQLVACADELKRSGIRSLHLFGSVAADGAQDGSDIDLFVDPDPDRLRKFSLFDLVGIKLLIEERLGIETDVTTRDGLHPAMRAEIERSAVKVF